MVKKPFLLTELGAAYQYELERLLSERDLEIMPILEIGNTETIIHLLKKGMGLSFLPAFTVKEELEKKRFSEVRTNLPSVVSAQPAALLEEQMGDTGKCRSLRNWWKGGLTS